MKELLERVKQYGIGIRPLSLDDFDLLLDELDVGLILSDGRFSFTFCLLHEQFIVIPKRLRGLKRLFRSYHELAHVLAGHVQHDAHAAFYGLRTQWHDKNEFEADAIALISLIPKHLIEELTEEFSGTAYGRSLLRERRRLCDLYMI